MTQFHRIRQIRTLCADCRRTRASDRHRRTSPIPGATVSVSVIGRAARMAWPAVARCPGRHRAAAPTGIGAPCRAASASVSSSTDTPATSTSRRVRHALQPRPTRPVATTRERVVSDSLCPRRRLRRARPSRTAGRQPPRARTSATGLARPDNPWHQRQAERLTGMVAVPARRRYSSSRITPLPERLARPHRWAIAFAIACRWLIVSPIQRDYRHQNHQPGIGAHST